MKKDKMIINKDRLLQEAINHITELEENDCDIIDIFESWGLTGDEIYDLWEEYVCEDVPFRVCTVCGNVMPDGYYNGDYFCSDECLHTRYTDEEWLKACEEYEDDCYWTHWY